MAFTNYITQSVICTLIFYGHGFGLFEQVDRLSQIALVVAIWVLQLIWSPWWLARFRFGPLEWLWRSLTYMKLQPMAVGHRPTRPTTELHSRLASPRPKVNPTIVPQGLRRSQMRLTKLAPLLAAAVLLAACTTIAAPPIAPSEHEEPVGNLAELMRAILFPNSNFLFDVPDHGSGRPARGRQR